MMAIQRSPIVSEIRRHAILSEGPLHSGVVSPSYNNSAKVLFFGESPLGANRERFPADFAFQLSKAELEHWRSQAVTTNPSAKMGLRRPPFVFTQEGGAMLSAVLRSDRAVEMSIAIVRTFVRVRELMESNRDI